MSHQRQKTSRFRQKIRQLYKQAGLTQEDLAARMGCSTRTVSRMLKGGPLPLTWTLDHLGVALDLSAEVKQELALLMSEENIRRSTPVQTIVLLYPGVSESIVFWDKATAVLIRCVDEKGRFFGYEEYMPRVAVTILAHLESKEYMLRHLRYAEALEDHLFGLMIAPAYGTNYSDATDHDDEIATILNRLKERRKRIIFIDRKFLRGRVSDMPEEHEAENIGSAIGIQLVSVAGSQAGDLAVRSLLEAGHKPDRIIIIGIERLSTIQDRLQGAYKLLREKLGKDPVMLSGLTSVDINDVIQYIVQNHPTGIVALTSHAAIRVRDRLRTIKNIREPMIISLDEIDPLGEWDEAHSIARISYTPDELIYRGIDALMGRSVEYDIKQDRIRGIVKGPPKES